jgi:hypothetical protein
LRFLPSALAARSCAALPRFDRADKSATDHRWRSGEINTFAHRND